jgi:hypothetical protein
MKLLALLLILLIQSGCVTSGIKLESESTVDPVLKIVDVADPYNDAPILRIRDVPSEDKPVIAVWVEVPNSSDETVCTLLHSADLVYWEVITGSFKPKMLYVVPTDTDTRYWKIYYSR